MPENIVRILAIKKNKKLMVQNCIGYSTNLRNLPICSNYVVLYAFLHCLSCLISIKMKLLFSYQQRRQ